MRQKGEILVSERILRHNKMVDMINNHKSTEEEKLNLDKLRKHTIMEINIRYLNSQTNRDYVFPREGTDSDKDEQEEFPLKLSFEQTFYQLSKQNIVPKVNTISKHNSSSSHYLRIKSLGREKSPPKVESTRLHRKVFQLDPKIQDEEQYPLKEFRTHSYRQKKKKFEGKMMLPELKLKGETMPRSSQKINSLKILRTQENKELPNELQELIGKKLDTVANGDSARNNLMRSQKIQFRSKKPRNGSNSRKHH